MLGLLVGAAAFGLSLYRDRMYGQDLSDLEYFAAVVSDPREVPEAGLPSRTAISRTSPEPRRRRMRSRIRQPIPEGKAGDRGHAGLAPT